MILNTNSMEEMNNLKNEKQKGLVLILFYALPGAVIVYGTRIQKIWKKTIKKKLI